MTKLVPRWYQQEARDKVMQALTMAANANPVAAIVTGGGKSLVNAMLMQSMTQHWPGARVLSLAPSMELVKQNVDEALAYLPPALASRVGVYCAGLNMRDRLSQFVIGTPQSVARSVSRFGRFDFVVVDEAHTFGMHTKTAERIVKGLREANPLVRFVGMTATPFVMQGLKPVPLTQCGLFDSLAYDLTSGRLFNRLVREGYLSPIVAPALRFPQIDTEGIKTQGGDFDEDELAKRAMAVTRECVGVALHHAPDRRHFMWFAVNIEHAHMIERALLDRGETVVTIHGELDKGERISGIAEYLRKEHRHIVSVAMLTTGFNAKFVDCIVSLRPTRSLVLWRQIVGRGLRPYETKADCLVLDAGGNFARHGAINADIGTGDSRAGLWACSDQVVKAPPQAGQEQAREKSGIRFPVNSAPEQPDLRIVLGLMDEDADASGCGYLNDAEHLVCRQCGRARQGFLQLKKPRIVGERSVLSESDSYEIHDEEDVLLTDEQSRESRTLPVLGMQTRPFGNSVLELTFSTEFGDFGLRLDFDRTTAENKFFAQARKLWEKATGRKVPEAYRVLLQRELIPQPQDLTLTRFEDGVPYITEIRWIRNDKLESFRYDPNYA